MANNQERINQVSDQLTAAMEQAKGAVAEAATKVSDFFQGNPFETEVGKKIEMATDADRLQTENWGLNLEICDYINYTNDGGRNALRAIKRRLETQMGKNNGIVMYALTILETCVKNCDQRFKALVCQKEFINELVRMIGSKYDAPQAVQERVLELIQAWADAFRGNPALVGVCEVYDELKAKGVEFPATDFDKMAPIITPKRTVFTEPQQAATQPATQTATTQPQPAQYSLQTFPVPVAGNSGNFISAQRITSAPLPGQQGTQNEAAPQDPLTKLRADVDVVTVNITVLRDLLSDLKPGEELPEELQLVEELYKSLQNMQHRIVDLINLEFSDDVTYELITVNQEINNCFEKYTRYMAKKKGEKPLETPETEDAKQLREQLESFGVYEGVGTSKDTDPNRKSAEKSSSDEPQIDSLRTVAMEKPMLTDDQAKEVAEWLGQEPAPKEPETKQKPDDGL
ncbi:unnamed protein product [Bursaphelenchus okinawaensis]|uniref:VHS domain-containing protein n=1 Tax=Bursaphelenchus okinawaensis TaxID=465554 RepID=A0A811KJS9_9BILA|nr:unnamed protein product [Bursaphelenchus okinawaensis]CAG9105162.1 unnamed protein product [Bursaphelenchus okinawaensis]